MVDQAHIANLAGLTELASRDGIDIKPTLLRVTTDLYVQKPQHSAEEERHYVELAVRLIDQVDPATRAIVAGRLSGYAAAPQEVIERLAQYQIERGEAQPVSLAGRNHPVSVEPERPDTRPKPAPAGAAADAGELTELFLAADAEERQMILRHLEYSALSPAAGIAPHVAQGAIQCLEMAALNHNSEAFIQEIERTLSIERGLARRLIDDASGEPVLVIALALQMPADVLQRLLLCLNPAISHSVLRVYELSKLYGEIERQSALRLLAVWQAAQPQPRPQRASRPALRPQHYDDNKTMPGMPARPTIRWEEHARRREGES